MVKISVMVPPFKMLHYFSVSHCALRRVVSLANVWISAPEKGERKERRKEGEKIQIAATHFIGL